MRRWLPLVAVLGGAWPRTARAQGIVSIPQSYQAINRPAPELILQSPFFAMGGEQIHGVRYSLDGGWSEAGCSTEDRNGDGRTCGQPLTVDPGPHVLAVVLCTRADCTAFGKAWHVETRFSVGLRERVTIDLARLSTVRDDAQAMSRQILGQARPDPCVSAVEQAFYANTCRADGVAAFKQKLVAMDQVCRSTWSPDTDLLLQFVLWEMQTLDSHRCYKAEELKRLPEVLTGGGVSEGFWPPGTIAHGSTSWRWARQADRDPFARLAGEALRRRVLALVDELRERQLVVDQLVDAYLDPARRLAPLVDAAVATAWSLNPVQPVGHRLFLLSRLPGPGDRFRSDPRLKAYLARGGGADTRVHCAYYPEIRNLVNAYADDKVLSPEEWQAVLGFLARTPADQSFHDCARLFRQEIGGPIPLETRLEALGKADCAKGRDPKVQGTTLSSLVDPDHHAVPREVRLKLMRAFDDCVAF
jgi:hypothetical protein